MKSVSPALERCGLVVFVAFCVGQIAIAGSPEWPEFRGPGAQGIVPATDAPSEWGEDKNVVWKTPIPGEGWSSPVVMGDQVWMTTAIESGETRPESQGAESVERIRLIAICVSRSTGKVLHSIDLFDVEQPEKKHALNSYASPTPVVADGKVWCHFGRNGTACLDAASGDVVWKKAFVIDHYVGAGSSPVLVDGLLVLTCDGADKQFVLGVDASTGDVVWRTDRPPIRSTKPDARKSFCTPLLVEHEGEQQLIIPGAQWIVAYEPRTGNEIWRFDHGRGFSLVPRPVTDGRNVYFCTGFAGNDLQAIRLGGRGELDDSQVAWRNRRLAPKQPSPVVRDGVIATISDSGVAQGLDTSNGKPKWKQRIGGNFSASVLLVNKRYWFFSREGIATAVDAEGQVVHRNQLDGALMATPAIVDGQWLIRTDSHLYCIGK